MSPATRRWPLPVATFVLMVLGIVAVTVAITLVATDDDTPTAAPTTAGPPSTSAALPSTTSTPVSGSADPAWVTAASTATGLPEAELAAYAAAAISVQQSHPGCGLGWNSLAAIGQVTAKSPGSALGPLGIDEASWGIYGTDGDGDGAVDPEDLDDAALSVAVRLCAVGGDVTEAPGWRAAIAAHHPGAGYARQVGEAAARFATLAPTS